MDYRLNKYFLMGCLTLTLVSCGPQKEEESQSEQQQATPMMDLQKPDEVGKPAEKELPITPHQKEELQINEDNVMNPLPG